MCEIVEASVPVAWHWSQSLWESPKIWHMLPSKALNIPGDVPNCSFTWTVKHHSVDEDFVHCWSRAVKVCLFWTIVSLLGAKWFSGQSTVCTSVNKQATIVKELCFCTFWPDGKSDSASMQVFTVLCAPLIGRKWEGNEQRTKPLGFQNT